MPRPAAVRSYPTLRQFLDSLFPAGTDPRSIHLCSFPGSPRGGSADWTGFRLDTLEGDALPADHNNYFVIGVLDPRTKTRFAHDCVASPIVALDDVGTKVAPSTVTALLTSRGIVPAAVIETSQGNYSLFYRIMPPVSGGAVAMHSLRLRLRDLGLTDRSVIDPSRYMRLPYGVNGKSGFRVRLRRWVPGAAALPYALWASALWSSRAVQRADYDRAAAAPLLAPTGARRASFDDPLVLLAAAIGLEPHASTRPGVIEADCPFTLEHTGGDPSGFAFLNWGRCHCHHGHCAERRSGDFMEEMVRQYDEMIELGVLDGSYRWTADDTLLLDRAGDTVAASGRDFLVAASFQAIGDRDTLDAVWGKPAKITPRGEPPHG